jgi:2,3-diketo-5-methylthio-1-phosphopentane phosphatase
MKKRAFVSDFDGTISKDDFFNMVINRFLKPEDLRPWQDYLDKKITHIEALGKIFSKVRINQKEMDTFIESIEIDDNFERVCRLCKSLCIPIYICSAGMDYYITKRIGKYLKEYDIALIANSGEYGAENGFKMSAPPEDDVFYNSNTGISKEAVVGHLKAQGCFTIYAGDGIPDIKAAKISDAVFAKSVLLDLCKKAGIKTHKFDSFEDIYKYIKDCCGKRI